MLGFPSPDRLPYTGVSWFEHLDTSTNFAGRDYACPARNQGMRTGNAPANNPYAIGTLVSTAGMNGFQCSHGVTQPFNQRLGTQSTLGLFSTYSNPAGQAHLDYAVKTCKR